MEYNLSAPAFEEPFPKSATTSAGTTNSPSARRASCIPPIFAFIESLIPSPIPSKYLGGSDDIPPSA